MTFHGFTFSHHTLPQAIAILCGICHQVKSQNCFQLEFGKLKYDFLFNKKLYENLK